MTWEQLFVWLIATINAPFIVLLVMGWIAYDAVRLAQRAGKLDMANMFKDDAGKESGLRITMFISCFITSWCLMADITVNKAINVWAFGLYLATWSGAPVFVKALEKWDGSFKKVAV